MRFYYFSSISWLAYAVVAAIAVLLLWLLWTKLLKLRVTNPIYWVLIGVVFIGPWVEELWIAYNFDQLCRRDAGLFVNKVVPVDGYYDDTALSTRIVGGPAYKFIEGRNKNGKVSRVERASEEEKAVAIAWYTERNGKQPNENEWITQPVSAKKSVTVEMNTGYAWRTTRLGEPTARYQYKRLDDHTPVAHRIWRFDDVVLDARTGDVLGRYTNYVRGPYSFFISLDVPVIECREIRGKDPLVYRSVLRPAE